MSNSQVIAATTATLRLLLANGIPRRDPAIPNLEVTTLALDRVEADMTRPALNLFLYQTLVNGAWINRDEAHARPGEAPLPPLALNLHYLLTSYGQVDPDDGDFSQRVLGAAVGVLLDHPVLSSDEIVAALPNHPALRQVERMHLTPVAMTIEEMSKLWTVFQTQYRLSIAYEVAVALIESDRAVARPLPVLKRGKKDEGAFALTTGVPSLTRAQPPRGQAAVRLGETLVLEGDQLATSDLKVRIGSPFFTAPKLLDPEPGAKGDRLEVTLPRASDPDVMKDWAPGFYTASVVAPLPAVHDLVSNAVPFALAPTIELSTIRPVPGTSTLTVSASPQIRAAQEAMLLLGSHAILPTRRDTDGLNPTNCDFEITGADQERATVRLRVDGVDSIPVGENPLEFDPEQTVVFSAP